jgi:hypothetical protein
MKRCLKIQDSGEAEPNFIAQSWNLSIFFDAGKRTSLCSMLNTSAISVVSGGGAKEAGFDVLPDFGGDVDGGLFAVEDE